MRKLTINKYKRLPLSCFSKKYFYCQTM
uniref:Uncharacterized protein n=1 Tax=Triticum urartu TaxID=4572 RepID=A0A8R7TAZ6_TRIUA